MSNADAAATALAAMLPTTTPLTAVQLAGHPLPAEAAEAVRATFVGRISADLVVVPGDALQEALSSTSTPMAVADAVLPAIQASTATLGPGVSDVTGTAPVGEALTEPGRATYALIDEAGATHAWFAIAIHPSVVQNPSERASGAPVHKERASMRLLNDVEMNVTVEIGRTRLPVRQVLDLTPGAVLELDRPAGSPADILVNGRLIARGEVVVVDEDYGVRVTEVISAEDA